MKLFLVVLLLPLVAKATPVGPEQQRDLYVKAIRALQEYLADEPGLNYSKDEFYGRYNDRRVYLSKDKKHEGYYAVYFISEMPAKFSEQRDNPRYEGYGLDMQDDGTFFVYADFDDIQDPREAILESHTLYGSMESQVSERTESLGEAHPRIAEANLTAFTQERKNLMARHDDRVTAMRAEARADRWRLYHFLVQRARPVSWFRASCAGALP